MRRIINKFVLIILLIVVFFSGFKIADYYYEAYKQKQLFNTVEDKINKEQKGKTKVNGKQIQNKYLELFKENNDFVGWIKIKDTKNGRNCICIARHYYDRLCKIDCVNILDLAIEKLYANADEYGVTSNICGIVKSIDDYQIKERNYDLVMAVSSLEHVDSKEIFVNKLREIEHGIRKNGIVCLVVNSNIKEFDKKTGNEILPQFEVCLPTEEMQRIFEKAFSEWTVLKSTVVDQQYDIPRDSGICELKTSVVTFVAKKG